MSFCGNCGFQLPEDARVCGNCGTPLESITLGTTNKIAGVNYVTPEKKAKNEKRIKIVLKMVILSVVLVIVLNVASGFVGYKGVVRKIMNAYENYDMDTIMSVASDLYYCMEDSYIESYFDERIASGLDSFEEQLGHKYRLSYEITDSYTMTNHKLEELLDNLSYYEEFDVDTISKVKVVEVEVTAKGDGTLETPLELVLTKEADKWRLLYMN